MLVVRCVSDASGMVDSVSRDVQLSFMFVGSFAITALYVLC